MGLSRFVLSALLPKTGDRCDSFKFLVRQPRKQNACACLKKPPDPDPLDLFRQLRPERPHLAHLAQAAPEKAEVF